MNLPKGGSISASDSTSGVAATPGLSLIYLAPALLCCSTCLSGFIPAIFCLNSQLFAIVSLVIFAASLLFHFYILLHWRSYSSASPFAYAIVQPCLHLVLLAIALAVGATSLCALKSVQAHPFEIKNYHLKKVE